MTAMGNESQTIANENVSATAIPSRPVAKPPRMSSSPIRRIAGDLVVEWNGRGRYPPGPSGNAVMRTLKMARDPLPILLGGYEEFGPIFTLRLLHTKVVFMLGPEANHYVTVSHPQNFHWRESSFGDLIPLLGDGLLTIDDEYHDHARATMMPAFHREQVAASVEVMMAEATQAIEMLRGGEIVDVYEWMRRLAMRIAMRALLGLDPDEAGKGAAAAEHFERALEFYGIDFALRFLRGPGSPWRRMLASRKVLDEIVFAEIAQRRQSPDSGRMDVLSLLLDVRDEAGEGFSDREVRDQLMTLMFAGHDTSTSTLTFMMYELARRPDVIEKLQEEQDRVLGGETPDIEKLEREMPYLDQVLDEVLRLYPPAWIGPRRAVREFEFNGHTVPAGAYLNYCSWASHRIPEFFPEPEAFRPERFTRERKAALPRGAYVPFGGGKRICIGKRFGQIEVKLVATMLLQRLRLDLLPGRTMTVRQMPTLSPKGGLKMRVDPRESP
jgi:cytochrome P450